MSIDLHRTLLSKVADIAIKESGYDSLALSEDNNSIALGHNQNLTASVRVFAFADHLGVSYKKDKVGGFEAAKFFFSVMEKIDTKVIVYPDF